MSETGTPQDEDISDAELLEEAAAEGPLPVLAVVGRPNVGKSTLVNRVIGRREAVVEDVPGVTRDRVTYDATGTAGASPWSTPAAGSPTRGPARAGGRAGRDRHRGRRRGPVRRGRHRRAPPTPTRPSSRVLRRSGKPVVLAANKVDDAQVEADAAGLWNLGLGEPYAVSALHGRGSGELLDAVLAVLPEAPSDASRPAGPRRVALLASPTSASRACSTS